MLNESDKIEPGQIKFLEAAPPPLVAGEYIVRVKQTIDIPAEIEGKETPIFTNENEPTFFHVSAPRFSLDLSDISSVYPAAGSKGSYYKSLPHIVFNRKTLPWERTLSVQANSEAMQNGDKSFIPWMALLVVDEDEIKEHKIEIKSLSLSNILSDTNGQTKIPDLIKNLEPWDEDELKNNNNAPTYQVIDMPFTLFKDIVPYENELAYLAHARQVDTGNKEIAGINAKGWFSVLIANRIPSKDKHNTVFLVSLEGHEISENKLINGIELKEKNIRLVVLHNWMFDASGRDFEYLIDDLNKNISPLSLNNGKKSGDETFVDIALKYGFTPMNYQFRNGKKDVVWYRGPLVPVNIPKTQLKIFHNADSAMQYDMETDMFNMSYSAAWQLGRLLALKEKNYIKAIKAWKADFLKNWQTNEANSELNKCFDTYNISNDMKNELTEMLHQVESDEVLRSFIFELLKSNSTIVG